MWLIWVILYWGGLIALAIMFPPIIIVYVIIIGAAIMNN